MDSRPPLPALYQSATGSSSLSPRSSKSTDALGGSFGSAESNSDFSDGNRNLAANISSSTARFVSRPYGPQFSRPVSYDAAGGYAESTTNNALSLTMDSSGLVDFPPTGDIGGSIPSAGVHAQSTSGTVQNWGADTSSGNNPAFAPSDSPFFDTGDFRQPVYGRGGNEGGVWGIEGIAGSPSNATPLYRPPVLAHAHAVSPVAMADFIPNQGNVVPYLGAYGSELSYAEMPYFAPFSSYSPTSARPTQHELADFTAFPLSPFSTHGARISGPESSGSIGTTTTSYGRSVHGERNVPLPEVGDQHFFNPEPFPSEQELSSFPHDAMQAPNTNLPEIGLPPAVPINDPSPNPAAHTAVTDATARTFTCPLPECNMSILLGLGVNAIPDHIFNRECRAPIVSSLLAQCLSGGNTLRSDVEIVRLHCPYTGCRSSFKTPARWATHWREKHL